jgi:hypothetical protein
MTASGGRYGERSPRPRRQSERGINRAPQLCAEKQRWSPCPAAKLGKPLRRGGKPQEMMLLSY